MIRVNNNEIKYVDYSDDESKVSLETQDAGCSSVCSVIGDLFSKLRDSVVQSRVKNTYEPRMKKLTPSPVITVSDNTLVGRKFNNRFASRVSANEQEVAGRQAG